MKMSKRLFDLAAAAGGLLLLAPLFALVALLIKLDDGGPVFFRQERIGYRGRPFRIWKFRTMVPGAEEIGGQLTPAGDRRITRIGRFLRRTKIDELPQLINVFWGEMSMVGPRPEVARYVALYSGAQRRVLELVPGITDPASVKYRRESELLARSADPEKQYREAIMPDKIALNLEYAARAGLLGDIGVILGTLFSLGRPGREKGSDNRGARL
jgi:lipopolysaccharide/colanic/teichoic acid biosynthesis glycosyltransferase